MKNKNHLSLIIGRAFKVATQNILRNKILSAATVLVIATMIFIFNVIVGINFIARDSLADLNKKLDITVYLKQSVTENDINKITSAIKELEGVTEVQYISKEDALKKLKATNPDLTLSFEKYELENPLPATINITTNAPSDQETVRKELLNPKFQAYLSSPANQENNKGDKIINSVSKNLINLNNFTYQIVFWMVIIFIVGGTLVILNAIQMTVHTRNQEIQIMKLLGAPFYSIRLPFIFESIIYATLAIILSFIILFIVSNQISVGENPLLANYNLLQLTNIMIGELICTIFIATISSFIATDNYIHK